MFYNVVNVIEEMCVLVCEDWIIVVLKDDGMEVK